MCAMCVTCVWRVCTVCAISFHAAADTETLISIAVPSATVADNSRAAAQS